MAERKLPAPRVLGAESWFPASLFASYVERSASNKVRVWIVVDAL